MLECPTGCLGLWCLWFFRGTHPPLARSSSELAASPFYLFFSDPVFLRFSVDFRSPKRPPNPTKNARILSQRPLGRFPRVLAEKVASQGPPGTPWNLENYSFASVEPLVSMIPPTPQISDFRTHCDPDSDASGPPLVPKWSKEDKRN